MTPRTQQEHRAKPWCAICGNKRPALEDSRYCGHCSQAVRGPVRVPSSPKALAALKAIHENKPSRWRLPWRA